MDTVLEGSLIKYSGEFKDSAGVLVTPKEAYWSLVDSKGAVVNDRTKVDLILATTYKVSLSGSDTTIFETNKVKRTFVITALYDSATDGNDQTMKGRRCFEIQTTYCKS